MKLSFSVVGLSKLRRRVKALKAAGPQILKEEHTRLEAIGLAAIAKRTPIDTGQLRQSQHVTRQKIRRGYRSHIGSPLHYAPYANSPRRGNKRIQSALRSKGRSGRTGRLKDRGRGPRFVERTEHVLRIYQRRRRSVIIRKLKRVWNK